MKRYFNGTWKFGTAKLVHQFNKWFLHIPMTKNFAKLELPDVTHVVGIDLGVNFLATSYDSHGKTTFFSGKQIKQKRGQYKALRKQLAKKQTPSARSRIKAIGSRENRYVTDVNHQITKALVERYPRGACFIYIQRVFKYPLNVDKASGGCHGFSREVFERARKNPDAITPRRD